MPSFSTYIFIRKSLVKKVSVLQIVPSLDLDSDDFKTGLEVELITMKQKFNDLFLKLPDPTATFSAYISIKKSLLKNKSGLQNMPSLDLDGDDFKTGLEMELITMKQKSLVKNKS